MEKFATRDRSITASAGGQVNLKKSQWGLLSAKKTSPASESTHLKG
jgi:hypothetical protein